MRIAGDSGAEGELDPGSAIGKEDERPCIDSSKLNSENLKTKKKWLS